MAVVGYTLLGLLTLFLLLLCIPVRFSFLYCTGQPVDAAIRWLFLKVDLNGLPTEHGKEPPEKEQKQKKAKEKPKAEKKPMEFAEMLEIVSDLLSSAKGGLKMLVRGFRFYRIRLGMVVAEGDAAQTAIHYGRINAAVYAAYSTVQGILNMEKPEIDIRPDFTAESGSIDCEVRARMVPLVAAAAVLRIGIEFLIKLLRRKLDRDPQSVQSKQKTPDKNSDNSNLTND